MEYTADHIPADMAREAIEAQSACNLSGVVHAMSRTVTRLWELAHAGKHGTDWVNQHPIMVLYADKLADLAGRDMNKFSRAYDLCDKAVEQSKVPA